MDKYFLWYKVIHIVSVISWMAAMLYMPRLFIYHMEVEKGSQMDKIFQKMEYNLQKIIMTPSMILTYIFGLLTAYVYGVAALGIWFYIKMLCVLVLTTIHGLLARCRSNFVNNNNRHSVLFFRIINEIPTIMIIIAVIMVVVKPFE